MTRYDSVRQDLLARPRTWLITGAAGFIGSNLLEALLGLGQTVVGLDDLSSGHRHNLDEVRRAVGPARWANFTFIEGDVRSAETCRAACRGVDVVLHHAALGSVPASLDDPVRCNAVNVDGFLNILVGAREAGVATVIYAASSATYGDHEGLPKVEGDAGRLLSPYAVTKRVNELYAEVFHRCYGFDCVGLRYFNVFGPRQDPNGAYAAVIPQWIAAMVEDREIFLNGDGETTRDFCFVDDVVQANLLAACAPPAARNRVYNVAVGARTSLNELFEALRSALARRGRAYARAPVRRAFRAGDVRHSQADIGLARRELGFAPAHTAAEGLDAAMGWYVAALAGPAARAPARAGALAPID